MFRFRTNTLNLNDRKRHKGESTECSLCKAPNENLEHFLLECTSLEKERGEIFELQRPQIENRTELLSKLLFDSTFNIEVGLQKLWIKRLTLMEAESQ